MSYFAEIDKNNIVVRVIVADLDFITSGAVGNPDQWIETFETINSQNLRKNYAGIGYTYDNQIDAFIPPKPFNSWTLNRDKGVWEPPIPLPTPNDKNYVWDEKTLSWLASSNLE